MAKVENAEQRRGIKAACISKNKGPKSAVASIQLTHDLGVEGDFHAVGGLRLVSLLAEESIEKMRAKGLTLAAGAFGENIVTTGINLVALPIGQKLKIGEAEIEITQIGKECVDRCAIYHSVGDCIMPRDGVFAKVLKNGKVKAGDKLEIIQ